MTEHTFTRGLNTKLRKLGVYVLKLNLRFAGGVPDCFYSGTGGDLWLELKYIPRKVIKTLNPVALLSALQLDWLNKRHDEGRSVAVVIGSPSGNFLLTSGAWNFPLTHPVSLSTDQIVDWITNKVNKIP